MTVFGSYAFLCDKCPVSYAIYDNIYLLHVFFMATVSCYAYAHSFYIKYLWTAKS